MADFKCAARTESIHSLLYGISVYYASVPAIVKGYNITPQHPKVMFSIHHLVHLPSRVPSFQPPKGVYSTAPLSNCITGFTASRCPIPTVFQPQGQSSQVRGTIVDLAYDPQSQTYQSVYPVQPEIFQPIEQADAARRLRERLANLEKENARLRSENHVNISHLQALTEEIQQAMSARIEFLETEFRRLVELSTNQSNVPPQQNCIPVQYEQGMTSNGPIFNCQHRFFGEMEKLSGNQNFREWYSALLTEFQVLVILETIVFEFATSANWSPQVRMRADALAISIIIQSVTEYIKPQIRDLPSAFQMRSLLLNQYQTISSFEPHKLVTQLEWLTFAETGSAIALIEQGITIRDKHKLISNKLSDEFYWSPAILRKLLPFYQLEAQFLMTFLDITLEQVHNYFAECVFDSFEPDKANALYQIAVPSNAPPKLKPSNPTYNNTNFTPKMYSPK